MDFFETIESRRSVRRFDPAVEVPPETVVRLLNVAILAPSAGNRQPWHFYIVRDPELRERLVAAAHGQGFIGQAPVAIVVCADAEGSAERYGRRGRDLYCLQDTAAAVEHILLAAAALGWGSCWIGDFDESEAVRVLDLPAHHRPIAILPIGKPAEAPGRRPRRPLGEVVTHLE
ncbi:MAG: nitroreductase family protein [Anaerolineae bacterium]|nr:nitroreductase family protein [Anaerolineae bacterium]